MSIKRIVRNLWRHISPTTRARIVRATQDQFTVSTAVIVLNSNGEVLLLNHVLRPLHSWGFPGGFVEHGEEIEAAVRREAREETGIELDAVKLVEINTFKRHIEVLWTAKAVGKPEVRSAEIIELRWFPFKDVSKLLGHKQQRQVVDALKS